MTKMRRVSCLWIVLLANLLVVTAGNGAERDWKKGDGFRSAPLPVPKGGKTGFTLLSPVQTGVTFTNSLEEIQGAANRVLSNGSGVAVGDFDNDGLADIYFCSLNGRNTLYRNLGNWTFKDVTAEAGLTVSNRFFRGATFADLTGDGNLDLLVATTGGGVMCYVNDGQGKFSDTTAAAGTATRFGSVTLALADVNGDGALDLYVCNNRTDDIRDRGQVDIQKVRGKLVIPPAFKDRLLIDDKGQFMEFGESDVLYLNDGKGHFTPVSWTNGTFLDENGNKLTGPPLDWGLTATFRDINGDGLPDLYVCNDYWTPDRIWINDGQGHFRAIPKLALRNMSGSSMGVDFADVDRDGRLDFFVVDMLSRNPQWRKRQMLAQTPAASVIGEIDNRPQFLRNTFFFNRGDGTYAEMANYSGLAASEWSWSPVFIDVDLDGYEDLLVTTGHYKDVQDLDASAAINARQRSYAGYTNAVERQKAFTHDKMMNARLYPYLSTPIVAFRNLGQLRFEEATRDWGTDQPGVHHAIATADFDNDGDLDFVVNSLGSAAGIYRNETVAPRVAVRLKGLAPNTQGIGARIKLLNGAVPMQSQEVISGGRYMSGSDPMLVFAAGTSTNMTLEIDWRSGKQSVIHAVGPDRLYEIDETSSNAVIRSAPESKPPPRFEDVSERLGHTHQEEVFDDFERQPLLPRKLSQLGPGATWYDVNGDGFEDLVIGSGKGGRMAVHLNDGRGGFKRTEAPPFSQIVTRDQTTVLGWSPKPGSTMLLAGSASYEDGLILGGSVILYDLAGGTRREAVPGQASSTGPLALADMDGDGVLELFVGGRVIPGRYPEPASSQIHRYDGNLWQPDAGNSALLNQVGLVSGAVWSDLDGDGLPELILACEWGPLRIFKNRDGKLEDATKAWGFDKFAGWWNGVATGDFDGDGRLDVIAGNWGLNSSYQASTTRPLPLYFGDLGGGGGIDVIETEFEPQQNGIAPRRMLTTLANSMPWLRERFPTHRAYSEASISKVLGDQLARTRKLEVNTLASMVFLNRGDRFEAVELPLEAQLAPVFGVSVADFDGDGNEDAFLSQNFFSTHWETPRLDAGRGVWLRGDGKGGFKPVPAEESGIAVYGEQRGCAVADYDGDGRVDLAVTQNGAPTRLFHNADGKPGLRVRLIGPPGNPNAIGARLRLKFPRRVGPVREIHAGSGYWSQDSPVAVLAMPEPATQLLVHWPGGKETTHDIDGRSLEVIVNLQGIVTSTPAQ